MTRGAYNTRQKRELLNFLQERSMQHFSVDEVVFELQDRGEKIGRSTVYRYLELLAEQGSVRKYQSVQGITQYISPGLGTSTAYPLALRLFNTPAVTTVEDAVEQVAESARLALQESPFDRDLMHMRAIALYNSGVPQERLTRFWERILRIDPEDSIAAFYREAAESGALDQMPLEFSYQVPPEEYMRRLKRLAGHLNGGFAHVHEAWETDAEFRKLIRWAVAADDQRLGRASMTVLATLESPEAVRALREAMFAPDVSRELKLHAAVLLKVQGREIEQVLPEPMASGDALVDTEALLGALPVGDRQLVRYADEVLEQEYGVAARPALTLMWSGYRRMRGTKGDPLKRVEAAAAALAYNYLLAGGERPSIARLAKLFGCTPRQLTFCAERIASCLEQDGAEPNSEEKR